MNTQPISQQSSSAHDAANILAEELENEELQKTIARKEYEKEKQQANKTQKKKPSSVSLISLWKYAKKRYLYLVVIAIIGSIASGVLAPLVITIIGRLLHKVGNQTYFFDLSPPALKQYLHDNHISLFLTLCEENSWFFDFDNISLVDEFHPTIMDLVYFGIGMFFSAYLSEALWVYTSEAICKDMREKYVRAILRQDIGWHDSAPDGSLTTRLALDTQLIQDGMGEKLGMAFRSIASFLAAIVIAFVYGWKLALVMTVCLPISSAIGIVVVAKIKKFTTETQEVYAHAGAVAEQAFAGIRTVYAFSLQNRFTKRYDNKLVDAERYEAKRGFIFGIGMGTYFSFQYAVYALGFWYGSKLVIRGELAGSDVMVVFFALILGTTALVAIPTSLQAIGQAHAAAYKVLAVIDRIPTIDSETQDGIKKEKLVGEIEFKNVDFHYPTRPDVPILKNLSLKIHPGQTVAFVGPSGSGKSTSVALVQRLYDVIGGEVLIDGQNIKDYNIHSLRNHIGLVGQEPVLFNMTIKQNILMGTLTPVSEKRLVEVCKMANCHNFISMLPHGYDTSVGEYGGMLSGGQKQRIAIARALIRDPQILLLDEATSALDTASERIVQKALETASQNRTTIVIAHRLSTIRHADLIVVMDKGELIEQGTHNSLYEMNGVYHSLVEKQRIMLKEKDSAPTEHVVEEEKFNVPNQDIIVAANPQVVIEVGDGMLSVPDAFEMTRAANARRAAEKVEIVQKKKAVDRSYTLAILRLMRQDWGLLILGVIGAAVAGATFPVFAYLLGHEVIELLSPDKSSISPSAFSGANLYAFLFVMVGIAALFGFTLQNVCFDYAGAKLTRKLRMMAFQALLTMEVGFYDEDGHTLGALTSRLASEAADVSLMVGRAWGETTQFFVTIIVGLILCFITAANVSGVVLILMPVAFYATYYRSSLTRSFEQETRKAYSEASTVAAEAIKSIRTVVALCQESWFVDRFAASLEYPHKLGLTKLYKDSLGFALNGAIAQFIAALTYYAGMRLIQGGHVGFKEVYVVLLTAMVTTQALGRSSTWSTTLDKGKIGAIKTWEIFDRQTTIDPNKPGLEPSSDEFEPSFDFANVSFTYPARPNQPIFAGEFNVGGRPNQTLALVGPSGCGKSTTIGMLERWYDCTGGSVSVGGHNVKEYQVKRGLRHRMALVGQEPVLFDMTIRENLLWGSDNDGEDESNEVSLEEIMAAATMANVHKFISSLPNGYNTRVGDKGSQLSGGQKQRIAIARALIRKPKILLLDEATSALDSESEKLVQQALDKAAMGRTTVTIAHRLSTIQNADQIAVVQGGKIIEMGRHFELLELNGLYADLVRQQDLGVN